ncbi:putative secreted protein (Por secretion system target) [Flavobacterium sp. 270]|uniref:carbohydrate-binding protein n=1 Tax=Flavobacterium sp. 270 TaxID=2512114 RepID=UPI001064DB0E|nr:carbohydrate-binding protein [Flavobacterium sp. 270]TDW48130.1 putative secreted protein (Por secretion system target) [Flavobacterium sp. 270]
MKKKLQITKFLMLGLLILSPLCSHAQIPNPNADTVYNGWRDAFLINSGDGNKTPYFCQTLANRERAFFWQQAYLITTVEDAYFRSPSDERKQFISDLLTKLIAQDLTVWTWDSWNDDLQWAMIACIRGYQITGNTTFRDVAVDNWYRVFDRGWDNTFNGGIWEDNNQIPDGGKCGLSNWPQIIPGCLMVETLATSDPATSADILNKCKQIYAWGRTHLWDPNTGRVYEGYYPDATRNFSGDDNSYNYGLLTNSAASLYKITKEQMYYDDAVRVADKNIAKINSLSGGIMTEDKFWNGGFGGEQLARGIAKLANENYLWNKYYPFLKANADAAWSHRRTDYNFTHNNFSTPTQTSGYDFMAMELTGCVTIQQVTPVLQSIPNTIQAENYHLMNGVSTEPSTDVNGNRVVSWIDANDYIDYVINVPASGSYTINYRTCGTGTGSVAFQQNGVTLATTSLPPTGNWTTWTTVSTTVNLTAGIQSIRLLAKANGWNLNWWSATQTGCTATAIVPYVSINGVWTQTANASLNAGGNVSFGPQPTTGGTWSWTGPNGYTSTNREITLNNIQGNQFGTYTAKYTNACGAQSTQNFVVTNTSAQTLFQAENAAITNGTINNGATGQYVDMESGGKIVWTVPAPASGNYAASFNVGVPAVSTRNMGVYANGTRIGAISSNVVGFSVKSITLPLVQGNNTIELRDSENTTELNVDYLSIPTLNGAQSQVASRMAVTAPEVDSAVDSTGFYMYPNPSEGVLNIELKDEKYDSIQIFNSTGFLIYSKDIKGENTITIDGRAILKTGIYIVSLQSKNKVSTKKLLVK